MFADAPVDPIPENCRHVVPYLAVAVRRWPFGD